jgi:prevent-host-death family protein
MKTIPAGRFKDQCLKIMEAVAETRSPVIVTKRGRPVVRIVPCSKGGPAGHILAGSILKEEGDPFGTGEKWHADLP